MSKELEARQALHMIERSVGEHGWFGWEEVETLDNAINELEELRKRNEPMEIIYTRVSIAKTEDFWHEPACPNCKSLVIDGDKFCRKCGQKLKWKEKENE